MELELIRQESENGRTDGDLYVDEVWFCYTLEDQVREIPGRPPAEWKVHGKTAIPAGRYRVSLEDSPRFGPETVTIHNVPGFIGVRVHGGNTERDTEGCPLVGTRRTETGIANCKPALDALKDHIRRAVTNGESVWITIKRDEY